MNLIALALWAMLGASPAEHHTTRLAPVAAAIAASSEASPVFSGDFGQEATALALVAIGRHESGMREEVRRCKVTGDNGRSVGIYQLIQAPFTWQGHLREEICKSDELQAELALSVLTRHRVRCGKGCSPRYLFRAYASGDGGKKSKASDDTMDTWERLMGKARLRVVGLTVTRIPDEQT